MHTANISHLTHTTNLLQSPETMRQDTPNRDSPYSIAPIHVLDDDSLLNIFYLFRSDSTFNSIEGIDQGDWCQDERSWHQISQVCRRWRHLILGSASYLQVYHVCTYGRPVADMLAHSPHLPIVLDYIDGALSIEDRERVILALQQRHRVRHIRLSMPGPDLRTVVPAIDGEFPMLESLSLAFSQEDPDKINLILPPTLQASHLRHLVLTDIDLSPVLQILTTSVSLVTLVLNEIYPAYFSLNDLLQHLSLLPQLKFLTTIFHDDASSTVIERQLLDAPVMTHVTFPHLHLFLFGGTNAFLEALLSHITTPTLETLAVYFFPQVSFSTANLLQFMSTTKNLRSTTVEFEFSNTVVAVDVSPDEQAEISAFSVRVASRHFEEQVSSMVQILDGFGPVFSAVERLAFAYKKGRWPLGHDEVDPAQWRRLLRSFRNVKTLLVDHVFVEKLSDFLQSDDEEHLLELLPDLKELSIPSGAYRGLNRFNRFIDARQIAGRPVTLVRR